MSLASATVKPKLVEFATYARSLKGDEKGEAQLFLDRFFRALEHTGIKEAGATLEFRIAKKPGSAQLELITGQPAAKAKGGKKFADLLWPDRVLIEMKKRGEHLEKHCNQLFTFRQKQATEMESIFCVAIRTMCTRPPNANFSAQAPRTARSDGSYSLKN